MPWKTCSPGRRPRMNWPCFNSATALMPLKTIANCAKAGGFGVLQFGHGSEAVEDRGEVPRAGSTFSFNSATALMPWKTNGTHWRRRCISSLQFGHGSDAVEDQARGP